MRQGATFSGSVQRVQYTQGRADRASKLIELSAELFEFIDTGL